MPGLNVVSGAPRAGKTSVLLDLAAQRYEADAFAHTLVLVPTARHADQFRQRLVGRSNVALGLDVTTFNLFARRFIPPGQAAAPDIARELLARVIGERAAADGDAARFRPIAGTAGLTHLVASAVGELITEGVSVEAFRDAARATANADLLALAEIFEAYRRVLAERGWRAPEEAMTLAAETLHHDRDAGTGIAPLVLVDGAQFLRAGEVALVRALAGRADVWVTLDPSAGPRAAWTLDALREAFPGMVEQPLDEPAEAPLPEAATAADDEAQLREIARSIKARLGADPALRPSDFAVTFRRVTPHLPLARQVFGEFALPLDPAAGERLAQRPFGAWLLRLLRSGVHGWRMEDLVHSLRAGFIAPARWGLSPVALDRLLNTARRQRLWSGLDQLTELPSAMEAAAAEDSDTRRAEERRAAGAGWRDLLAELTVILDPDTSRTLAEHATALDAALFGADGWVPQRLDGYPTLEEEVSSVRRDLQSFRAVDAALGGEAVRFEAFVTSLEARMQRPATILREAGGVLLAPMHTLHGLRFEHVYVAGLSEGEFPAPPRAAALLDRPRREALAASGLPLPPEARASEDDLWRVATSRAERGASLWRPRLAGNRPAAASYYFESAGASVTDIDRTTAPERSASSRELAIALVGGWPGERRRPEAFGAWNPVVRIAPPIEQRRRSFQNAGAHEGAVPGIDMSWLVAPEREWSPSRLESYLTCSFQFFGGYALGLSEVDEEATQADAATRGTVMHLMLDDAIAPLVERGEALLPEHADEVVARLRSRGRAIWDDAPRTHSFGRAALWRYEGTQALDQLEAMVRREADINRGLGITHVVGAEEQFAATLEGITPAFRVAGRADRVDEGPGLIQIVDYKTGRPIERRDVDSGKRLQLQIYALAARERWGDVRLVARYAFLRPPAVEWWLDTANEADRQVLDEAASVATGVRAQVEAGAFAVAPQVPDCPSYCAFIHACRVSHFSRLKSWN